jgi:YHS domain-containing protein
MANHEHGTHDDTSGSTCCGSGPRNAQAPGGCCSPRSAPERTAIDPVCKMEVDRQSPPGGTLKTEDGTFYFCSTFCRASFAAERGGGAAMRR